MCVLLARQRPPNHGCGECGLVLVSDWSSASPIFEEMMHVERLGTSAIHLQAQLTIRRMTSAN